MTNLSGKNLNEHFNCRPSINEKDFSSSGRSFNFGISHRSYQQDIKPP